MNGIQLRRECDRIVHSRRQSRRVRRPLNSFVRRQVRVPKLMNYAASRIQRLRVRGVCVAVAHTGGCDSQAPLCDADSLPMSRASRETRCAWRKAVAAFAAATVARTLPHCGRSSSLCSTVVYQHHLFGERLTWLREGVRPALLTNGLNGAIMNKVPFQLSRRRAAQPKR